MDFKSWKRRVNALLVRSIGVGADDLTDFAYFDAWKDERSPADVAYEVLNREGVYA